MFLINKSRALARREQEDAAAIFDHTWYRNKYQRFLRDGVEPFEHFVSSGKKLGFDPSPLFDSAFYLRSIPDHPAARADPLFHFLRTGVHEAINPHPLFDVTWYLNANPDVAKAGTNPLSHYVRFGAKEGRSPHPLFEPAWYVASAPLAQDNPLAHYWTQGRFAEIDPHPLFMGAFYRSRVADLSDGFVDLLIHYLEVGAKKGHAPNPLFDPRWYVDTYPEVRLSGLEPLTHFIIRGASEGKDPSPNFETLNYLAWHPDVREAGINPLAHYLRYGAAEGRKTKADASETRHRVHVSKELATPLTPPSDGARIFNYRDWLSVHECGDGVLALQRRQQRVFDYRPLISVIVPIYKVAAIYAAALIESVRAQTYDNWQLCLALAFHEDEELTHYLTAQAKDDPRIQLKILPENGGISRNSNAALDFARGEYVALLDHDDTISPNAFFEVAKELNRDRTIDFLYSDKDTMNERGDSRFNPLFKPEWSPELMLSINYLTHLNVMRTSRVREIGGWDPDTDGAQDWDIFLRFISKNTKVRSLRWPLYHWRVLPSSVASGLSAKPWAAAAQLRTISRYLQTDWRGAEAIFAAENVVRINWSETFAPSIFIAVCGSNNSPEGSAWNAATALARDDHKNINVSYFDACSGDFPADLNAQFEISEAEILVLLDARSVPDEGWLQEVVGPLQSPDIGAVGGRLEAPLGVLLEGGLVFAKEQPEWLFRGETINHWGIFCGATGYRNFLAVTGSLAAIRKSSWQGVNGFQSKPLGGRYDVDLFLRISEQRLGRIMHNSYARTSSIGGVPIFEHAANLNGNRKLLQNISLFCDSDPFFHSALTISNGCPTLRAPASYAMFDFAEEARRFASALDIPSAEFRNTAGPSSSNSIKSLAWFLPGFDVPFYGGIMTILRAANYLRCKHDIRQVFVVFTNSSESMVRRTISKAFPELAFSVEIVTTSSFEIPANLVQTDAAICTLWVTAYAMRRLKNVQHRFYFVQDYEPLFYPAGSTSALAEATYKLGFHGICNTYPLRQKYSAHGGTADHFLPSVDTQVFHASGRVARRAGEPFLLFNYARPGHPRNCFEVVAEGLIEAKRRLKSHLRIITAGADWNPKDYKLSGVVEHLGLLSYEDTGQLYRSVDAGLVAMTTPHPSYLPFELMACQAVVLTNRNPDTGWLLKDGVNSLLFELTKSSIADVIEAAVGDESRLAAIRREAAKRIAADHADWEKSCAAIASAILGA